MNNEVKTICHCCLKNKELTKEHFPPHSCFNNFKISKEGIISQNGNKEFTLCKQCNEFIGGTYIKHYIKLVKCADSFIKNDFNKNYNNKIIVNNINLLYCSKAILAMFLSIMPISLLKEYKFADYFLDKDKKFSTNKLNFQIFIGLSPNEYKLGFVKGNSLINGEDECFYIQYYPFKLLFVCSNGYDLRNQGMVDITNLLTTQNIIVKEHEFNILYTSSSLLDNIFK